MKILFVQDNALDESQALVDLAALLKAQGHQCDLVLDREETHLTKVVRDFDAGLIVIPCSMLNHGWARACAGRIKQVSDAAVVMGGTGPTLFPECLIDAPVDAIIRGEAEYAIGGIIDVLASGSRIEETRDIAGVYVQEGGDWHGTPTGPPTDVTKLPTADKHIYHARYPFMRRFPFKRFLASRGCHHRCSYCYIPSVNALLPNRQMKKVRRKTPEQAVEEVALAASNGPLTHVHFSDDLFTNDAEWLNQFAPLYRSRVGVPFTCNTSAELINDDVARALKEAGCHAIGFAVESASKRLRREVLRKGVTTDNMHQAAEHLRVHGVRLGTFNMIALPGETPDEALETALLNAELGSEFVRLNYAFPMPGTGMTQYAIEEDYLAPDWPTRFAQPDYSYRPGPQFATPYEREFRNLFVLFRLVSMSKRWLPTVRRALRSPTLAGLNRVLSLQNAWNEKRQFRIPVTEGVRFFAKVGRPELRATNFPSLL
jgi:anaerobic magnesium-protoporphyrin IX monomethyl ester cyclase